MQQGENRMKQIKMQLKHLKKQEITGTLYFSKKINGFFLFCIRFKINSSRSIKETSFFFSLTQNFHYLCNQNYEI